MAEVAYDQRRRTRQKRLKLAAIVTLVVVALLIVGAALGFVTLRKHAHRKNARATATTTRVPKRSITAGNVHMQSKVAATIAFDSKIVFYQDKDNNLILVEVGKKGTTRRKLQDALETMQFEAREGTPLAAVGRRVDGKEEVNLFFYTKNGSRWHLVARESLRKWEAGSMGAVDLLYAPDYVDTPLVAMNFPDTRPPDGDGHQYIILAYRYRDGRLRYRNETNARDPVWLLSEVTSDGYTEHMQEGEDSPFLAATHIYPETGFCLLPGTMGYWEGDTVEHGLKLLFDGGMVLYEYMNINGTSQNFRKMNGASSQQLPDWMKVGHEEEGYAYKEVPLRPFSKMAALMDERSEVERGGPQWSYSLLVVDPEGILHEYVWTTGGFWAPGDKTVLKGLDDKNSEEKDVRFTNIAVTDGGSLFGVATNGRVYQFDRSELRSKDIPQGNDTVGGLSREDLENKPREWVFIQYVDGS